MFRITKINQFNGWSNHETWKAATLVTEILEDKQTNCSKTLVFCTPCELEMFCISSAFDRLMKTTYENVEQDPYYDLVLHNGYIEWHEIFDTIYRIGSKSSTCNLKEVINRSHNFRLS